ncbi:MAG: NDMA-dependent alcohol dehydrogenase [Pseudonocardia sp.]|uniref:NDMA-dependent alcohol dehydrogenase n=1 Tax=unclassified Pseudonocardia TaxID=2619320 RepID=UPI00086D0F9A|nr:MULTISPECIES: NDMA-dependent alcohol dehydrogenase [unclassified Pseudonocardia]MBN9108627.1 NDMA-dependent alcohol dehydrogenase [Pseudonocardia sp.]ODV07738.1 MAG: alcohol dehydrogenase [Pseudonocardia sp. SCN 73-27]
MKTRSAVLFSAPGKFEMTEIELDTPRQDELVVKMVASGICHSDDHIAVGDLEVNLPMAGGHEGAGIVMEVGPNTRGYEVGDHVVLAWIPSCGRCRWCAQGKQNLCDLGAQTLAGARADDPDSYRLRLNGENLAQTAGVSTFSEYTLVSTSSAIRIPKHIPLDAACLAACSVGTGWGSAVKVGKVSAGQVAIVMGVGGVGIHAVQGAAMAGAAHVLAVDPVALRREAAVTAGATATYADIAEATAAAKELTNGQGADVAIVCVGVTTPDHIASAFAAIRKGGTAVVTGLGKGSTVGIPVSPVELALFEKKLLGSLYGSCVPTWDIPMLLDLYDQGRLKIDEFITRRYPLDRVNDGFAGMHAGESVKAIVEFP